MTVFFAVFTIIAVVLLGAGLTMLRGVLRDLADRRDGRSARGTIHAVSRRTESGVGKVRTYADIDHHTPDGGQRRVVVDCTDGGFVRAGDERDFYLTSDPSRGRLTQGDLRTTIPFAIVFTVIAAGFLYVGVTTLLTGRPPF